MDIGNNFSEIISPQDIAIYGGLCALVSFERSELKHKLIDNVSFKSFLEIVPDVRELINDFYSCRYASCLALLEKIRPELLLDIYLHDHVRELYEKIRNKALVQYVSPFTTVDLHRMAEAFTTNVLNLEKELARLIMEKQIEGRIDSQNKRLLATQTDLRNSTFKKSVLLGDEYQRNTKAILLHLNLLRNEIVVKPPRNKGGMASSIEERKGKMGSFF